MAIQLGQAGYSARRNAVIKRLPLPLFVLVATTIVAAGISISAPKQPWAWILLVAAVAAGLYPSRRDLLESCSDFVNARRWDQGADGEQMTAAELAKLPDDFVAIHDFHPIGPDGEPAAWNVDHIVVGPTGVFVLDTKNHKSRAVQPAERDRNTKQAVAQAQRNAAELKSRLVTWSSGELKNEFVVPVVVYVQPSAYIEKPREGHVRVSR
ncbi:MAG: NERD domain-containing protein [Coriobacteriales bacterium]|nr:NERD domain-containing protein [Coriobacteriales bacterium]